jgi:uncharacterized membrane protein
MDYVTAIFDTRSEAEHALRDLENIGITADDVSMLMSDETRGRAFKIEEGSKADEGAAAGATFGGVLGGVLAAVLSAGAIAIPGLNLVVSGALVSGIAGAGAGAATGGLLGALIGSGFKENEAKLYEKELHAGNILLAVRTHNSEQKKSAQEILKRHQKHEGEFIAARDTIPPTDRTIRT